jgi:hypothetical protein
MSAPFPNRVRRPKQTGEDPGLFGPANLAARLNRVQNVENSYVITRMGQVYVDRGDGEAAAHVGEKSFFAEGEHLGSQACFAAKFQTVYGVRGNFEPHQEGVPG